MNVIKQLVKRSFGAAGLVVEKRDRLAEQIPANYLRSPLLPPIYRDSVARLIYFERMYARARHFDGDLVECGVSIGTGILNWALLCELSADRRRVFGFDSFAGFPPSTEVDRRSDGHFQTAAGDYASPPELVLRTLEAGRVSRDFVSRRLHLVRGYFKDTVYKYNGRIALLHLDCDLYESYRDCLTALYPHVVAGGLILFDEYEDPSCPGARRAIDEFFDDKAEKPTRYDEYGYVKHYVVKC
jgi:hypothetical protein